MTVPREMFVALGGFDERFVSRGGGLVNHDFWKRACEVPSSQSILLLGEGTFHQFHGGVATNVPLAEHPIAQFSDEYSALRGERYEPPRDAPIILGTMPPVALPSVEPHHAREGRRVTIRAWSTDTW